MPPQDLQQLVMEFGGYRRIPLEVWIQYDQQLAETLAWLRLHHKPIRRLGQ
jgi:hypothetical protein